MALYSEKRDLLYKNGMWMSSFFFWPKVYEKYCVEDRISCITLPPPPPPHPHPRLSPLHPTPHPPPSPRPLPLICPIRRAGAGAIQYITSSADKRTQGMRRRQTKNHNIAFRSKWCLVYVSKAVSYKFLSLTRFGKDLFFSLFPCKNSGKLKQKLKICCKKAY